MNLVISLVCPPLVDAIGSDNIGYIFITTGVLTFFGTVFIQIYMKETMGKTKQEIEDMFYTERNKNYKTKKLEENNLLNPSQN